MKKKIKELKRKKRERKFKEEKLIFFVSLFVTCFWIEKIETSKEW